MSYEEWFQSSQSEPYTSMWEFAKGAFQAGAASRDAEYSKRLDAIEPKIDALIAERDQLRAQINVLRDAFETYLSEHEDCQDADDWAAMVCSCEAHHVADEALASVPEQSIAEYRNKVIEDCAVKADALANCEENTDGYRNGAAWCAEAIRARGDSK